MVLSKRVSLQWLPEVPEEFTSTMVFTSSHNHFVDVRIYKDKYPYWQSRDTPESFDGVFQWVIVGEEEEIEDSNKIRFNHSINSQEISKSLASGKPLSECRSDPDVGSFWVIEGTEDRKETGEMPHPQTGDRTEYVEIWRSLNPNFSSVEREVREGYDDTGTVTQEGPNPTMTFDLKTKGFIGRIIRLGNWVQGVIYEEDEKEFPISVMRSFWNAKSRAWQELIVYGKHKFPDVYKEDALCSNEAWERME